MIVISAFSVHSKPKITDETLLKLIEFQGQVLLNQQSINENPESLVLGSFDLPKASQQSEVQRLTDFINNTLNERIVSQMYLGQNKGEFIVVTQNKDTEYDPTYHVILRTSATENSPILFEIQRIGADRIEINSENENEKLWLSKSSGTFFPMGRK